MNAQDTIDAQLEVAEGPRYGIVPSDLGKGYDSLQRKVTFPALENITKDTSGGDPEAHFVVEYDYSKIRDRFGLKAKVGADTGTTTVELSVDVSSALDIEDMSVYVFYYQRVIRERATVTGYKIADRVADFIKDKADNTTIYKQLGNQVITQTTNGGELMLIAKFTSSSLEESKTIKAILDVDTNIFSSDVNLHTQLDLLQSKLNKRISYSVKPLAMGGTLNDDILHPATFQKGIDAWTASLANLPTVLEYECSDLNILDGWFTSLSESLDKNQAISDELNRMLINVDDSRTLTRQYQKSRRELSLPTRALGRDMIDRCDRLTDKLVNERDRLRDTAATTRFHLDTQALEDYKKIRHDTPIFNYQDLPKDESQCCGYRNSGMEPFGDEMAHAKYFVSMDVFTDVGLQGFSVSFDKFDSTDRVNRHYAQASGNRTVIEMGTDLLVSMQGWSMDNREGYPSAKCVQFTSLSGKTYGPPAEPGKQPAITIQGSAEEGAEKYIIGLWGSGNSGYWVQRVGPYFRACSTDYPYLDE